MTDEVQDWIKTFFEFKRNKKALVIVGGKASGKTTFSNMLASFGGTYAFVYWPSCWNTTLMERLVVWDLEDSPEEYLKRTLRSDDITVNVAGEGQYIARTRSNWIIETYDDSLYGDKDLYVVTSVPQAFAALNSVVFPK